MHQIIFALSFVLFASRSLAGPILNVDPKDVAKDTANVQATAADPRAKVIEELTQSPDEIRNIGLILDSSGSMGQILDKNKTKMFYLKKLMKGFVRDQWKLKNKIGVRVYGARFKGRCDDIALTIPYGDQSLGRLETSLEKMEPLGMTPLHRSIEATVKEMSKVQGPKNVVIVTDGDDTCGGDPCKTAEEVKKKKLGITFYVVALGFKGASDELKKISCLGDVQTANDAESFGDAMSQISSKISQRQNLKVISPNPDVPVYLYHLDGGKSQLVRVFYASSEQTVPPGNYEAVVGLSPLYKFGEFTVPPARKVTLRVEGDGEVQVKYFGGHIRAQILDKNNKVVTKFRSDQPTQVPTGKWRLRLFREPFYERIISDFYVYPNGHHKVDVNGVGVLKVNSEDLRGIYVYDQDNTFIDHALTGQAFVLKTNIYSIHVDKTCSFDRVEVRDKREVLTLDCPTK